MNQETLDTVNSDTVVKFEAAKDLVWDSYFKFAVGLAAVISMIVYPVVFQFYGIGTFGDGINWFPPASMVAVAMAAVLVFAWSKRFKSDRDNMAKFKKRTSENLTKMASEISKVNEAQGEVTIEVDNSGKIPRLVLRNRILSGNLLE